MTRRINARIDAALATKLTELQQRTGQSTTEILQVALERYYESVHRVNDPAQALQSFIGCASGPRELAANYKAALTRSLRKKSRR